MPKINPRISSLDDLLGVAREVENTAAAEDKPAQPGNNEIQMLSPEIIRGFRGHPFRLYEGERLNDLVESISENGVLVPAMCIPVRTALSCTGPMNMGKRGKPNCPGRRLPVSSNAWWMRGAIWRHPPSVSRCSRMKRSLSAANTAC